ncbi:MAG: hypothetical protein ACTSXQ_02795 [Alphaproteobacteria bacterium]
MKKYLLSFAIILSLSACAGLPHQLSCMVLLKPGASQQVCHDLAPVFEKHGIDTLAGMQDYVDFLQSISKNQMRYTTMLITGRFDSQTKKYIDVSKDAVVAASHTALNSNNPVRFASELLRSATRLGGMFK